MKTILLAFLGAIALSATPSFTWSPSPTGTVTVAPGGSFTWTFDITNTSTGGEFLSVQNLSFTSFNLGTLTELVSANPPFLLAGESSLGGNLARLDLSLNPPLPTQSGEFILTVEFLDSEFETIDVSVVRAPFRVDVQTSTAPIPEPSTWAMIASAGLAAVFLRRRR